MAKRHRKHKEERENEEVALDDTPKPLKLVLKVSGHSTPAPSPTSQAGTEQGDTPDRSHRKKKKKHKKDRKRGRDKDDDDDLDSEGEEDTSQMMEADWKNSEAEDSQDPAYDGEPANKKARVAPSEGEGQFMVGRSLRERKQDGEKSALNNLLDYLQRILSRKDVNGFFQFPVTDAIAPRYSEIITHPMDFSTMKAKIDREEYKNVNEYRNDFRLMCENCMAYNHPDTIFHKEAQRLLNIGIKQLSKEKLLTLRRSLPSLSEITEEELGLKEETSEDGLLSVVEYKKPRKGQMSKYEAIMDDASPEEILAQVQDAAKQAADELHARNPNGSMGYLERNKDGKTYLNFINPHNEGIVSETERVVNLGQIMGKLTSGADSLASFREDARNKAVPLSYLNYGPFSSYAPVYDSTTANLSKEDSDLLLSTYGDETGVQYSKSIRTFLENSGDYAIQMVDNLLLLLTDGQHTKTRHLLDQKEQTQQTENQQQPTEETAAAPEKADSLRSLSKLGIDMSFLDNLEKPIKQEGSKEVQAELDRTSQLLSDLNRTQHQRLSAKPPESLRNVPGPSDTECHLAEKVTEGLAGLIKQVKPEDISHASALRHAMGVKLEPLIETPIDTSSPHPQVEPQTSVDQKDVNAAQNSLQTDPSVIDNEGVEILNQGQNLAGMLSDQKVEPPSSVQNIDPVEQLLNTQFSQEMLGFSSPEGSENVQGFDISNGMDTSETEAAVANIL